MRIVGGRLRGRKFSAPKGLATRPTQERVREALFNICQQVIEDVSFLDLFAGSGAVAFEALSRGAKEAVLVDKSRLAQKAILKNAVDLGLKERISFFFGEAKSWVERFSMQKREFGLIYLDPPYSTSAEDSFGLELLDLLNGTRLLSPEGQLFIEDASRAASYYPKRLSRLELVKVRLFGESALLQYRASSPQMPSLRLN